MKSDLSCGQKQLTSFWHFEPSEHLCIFGLDWYQRLQFYSLFFGFFISSDHQETVSNEQSDKFSSVRETAKQIEAAREEEEEEEDDNEGDKNKETTQENSRGSNWERKQGKHLEGKSWGEWRCFLSNGLNLRISEKDEGVDVWTLNARVRKRDVGWLSESYFSENKHVSEQRFLYFLPSEGQTGSYLGGGPLWAGEEWATDFRRHFGPNAPLL